jgi:hypothetical protein
VDQITLQQTFLATARGIDGANWSVIDADAEESSRLAPTGSVKQVGPRPLSWIVTCNY